MSTVFLLSGIGAGITAILALWLYDPMLALLCIPMAASVLTSFALMLSLPTRKRRQHAA